MKQVILKMIAPVLLLVWGNQSLALDIFGRDAAEGGHGVKDANSPSRLCSTYY